MHRETRGKPAHRTPIFVAMLVTLTTVLSFTGGAGAEPQTEGAVRTLDNKPKSAALTATYDLEAACTLSAEALDIGCAETLACGPTLEVPCAKVRGGLDHVAVGTGLRNTGRGVLAMRGAPLGAEPVAAWLYWGSILPDADEAGARRAIFEGVPLEGERIGTAPEPCWARNTEFAAFRVSVLELLRSEINGEYEVEIPISSAVQGQDPWGLDDIRPPYTDGASLVVVYAHLDIPREARFYLHDVVTLLADRPLLIRHQLDPPPPIGSRLRQTRIGADGQRHAAGEPTAPIRTSFQTELIPWQIIRGPGSPIDPNSDWQGADGGSIDQLWDTQVTDLRLHLPTILSQGAYWLSYEAVAIDPPPPLHGFEIASPYTFVSSGPEPGVMNDCVEVVAHALTVR